MAVLSNTGIRAGASAVVAGDDSYRVKRSTKFNSGDSSYLNWTPAAAGNRKTWTWSGWVKRSSFGTRCGFFATQNTKDYFEFWGDSNEQMALTLGNTSSHRLETSGLYRDPSAWYHIVIALDTTQATASNRWKLYVNGSQVTDFDTENYPAQDYQCEEINNNNAHYIGADYSLAANQYFNGLISDIHFIDGTAKAASDFGETDSTTGQWVPKEYTGSYGTNGFYLAMDPANIGPKYSENVTATGTGGVSGISDTYPLSHLFDSDTSNYFATNAADISSNAAVMTLTFPSGWQPSYSSSVVLNVWSGSSDTVQVALNGGNWQTVTANNTYQDYTFSGSGTITEIKVSRQKNNSNNGAAEIKKITVDGVILQDIHRIGYDSSGNDNHWVDNNLSSDDTAIENFKAVTYDGLGTGNAKTITLGFKPDLVWTKSTSHSDPHSLSDSVRGVSKSLCSSSSAAEVSTAGSYVTAFNSDGYTLGNSADVNGSSTQYVAWCWKAGGAASALNTGSINASVSANTDAGFSIVSYTGTGSNGTVAHGLGKAPKLIIVKDRDSSSNWWATYHESLGNEKALYLNSSSDEVDSTFWNDTSPTSTVFSLGSNANSNASGDDFIAYCWSEIPGYSKFGSFSGSGSTVTIDCGFAPAYVLVKCRAGSSSQEWVIHTKELGTPELFAELASASSDSRTLNFLVDGFSVPSGQGPLNYSGRDYVYIAFSDGPDGGLDLLADVPGAPYDNSLNGGGNYATWNSLDIRNSTAPTISNGNLTMASSGGSFDVASSMAVRSGKWYCEFTEETKGANAILGILGTNATRTSQASFGTTYKVYQNNYGSGSVVGDQSGGTAFNWVNGDILGQALDLDSSPQTLKTYQNGVLKSTCNLSVTTDWKMGYIYDEGTSKSHINFGQRAFKYTPPTGYKALNTYNLSPPTITKGNTGFDVKLWTGNATDNRDIDGYLFSPDLVWIKERGSTGDHHVFDIVRGANKAMRTNETDAETTTSNELKQFNSDGFRLGTGGDVNASGTTTVGWAWDAGSAGSNTSVSAGGLNSSLYNQADTWSDNLASSDGSYAGGQNPTQAFNGVAGGSTDMCQKNGAGGNLTWTFSGLSGSVRVWIGNDGAAVTDGNGTARGSNVGNGETWLSLSGDISDYNGSIIITPSSDSPSLGAVEVAGKMLVDDTVTLANVPSIASAYRVNNDTGFSIVSYTGTGSNATVAHGLNAPAKFIIVKNRDSGNAWSVYHDYIGHNGGNNYIELHGSNGAGADNTAFQDTAPTSTVFYIGTKPPVNTNTEDLIAYCWSEVAGYSKFGSYTGNGSSNGPFVWCGFRPRWIMTKHSGASEHWAIYDTSRSEFNHADDVLNANISNAEFADYSSGEVDILSNGFKLRGTWGATNTSSGVYIFAAFAESPFKYSNAR